MLTRIRTVLAFLLYLASFSLFAESEIPAPVPGPLLGVWEKAGRFVEFSPDSMRIVLKTYYGFVYEPFPALPCTAVPAAIESEAVFQVAVRYRHTRRDQLFTMARAGNALFLDFMVRLPGTEKPAEDGTLDGFWMPAGSGSAIQLYPSSPKDDFFIFGFDGSRYFRIRYWKTDARERDVQGRFTSSEGMEYRLPKFFRIDGELYTCITATGKIIRNFEEGSVRIEDGTLNFEPDRIVFAGTEAAWRRPIPYTLSDGVLALGEPYLVRSAITDLDAEIAAHNAKRRPPRKPIFDFLELDFHWDEVARLRGNTLDR